MTLAEKHVPYDLVDVSVMRGEQKQPEPPIQPASPTPARAREASPESTPSPRQVATPSPARAAQAPVFIMETMDGLQGVLVTDERPREPGWVYLNVDDERIETPFIELRAVNVK